MSRNSIKIESEDECTKAHPIEIFFIEGVNGTGKDYFIDKSLEYFPNLTAFMAPRENYSDVAPSYYGAFVTFNTILRSAAKSTDPIFIYRSPITNFVYNSFYNRTIRNEDYVLFSKLLEEFGSLGRITFIVLSKLHHMNEFSVYDLRYLAQCYQDHFHFFGINPIFYEDFDDFIAPIDEIVGAFPQEFILSDVDDTAYQYGFSHRRTHRYDWYPEVREVVIPKESVRFPVYFISGRRHDNISGLINNPLPMKSSFNFKYCLIKKCIEAKKNFIFYDDYIQLLAKLADDFEGTSLSVIDSIGRLSYGLDDSII